jgi:hypothetical protein
MSLKVAKEIIGKTQYYIMRSHERAPLSEYQKGWIEAAIDFEGSLSLFCTYQKKRPGTPEAYTAYRPVLQIGTTDPFLPQKAKDILIDGYICPWNPSKPNLSKRYNYVLSENIALKRVLSQIKLALKDTQRLLLLEVIDYSLSERLAGHGGSDLWNGNWEKLPRIKEIWAEMRLLNGGKTIE